jgi:ribitol-5-phosphate 2-dehydrogenase
LLARNPQLQIVVFGTHQHKLERFDFAAERHNVRRGFREGRVSVDHAFECVGGTGGSTSAIAQIIDCIQPQGVLSLMGVSEQPVPINTRMVLEKGLTLQGNSRSSKQDFEHAVELFRDPAFAERAVRVIEHVAPVRSLDDAQAAFEWDETHAYKTIMDWQM